VMLPRLIAEAFAGRRARRVESSASASATGPIAVEEGLAPATGPALPPD
jgi:hypothetical protein